VADQLTNPFLESLLEIVLDELDQLTVEQVGWSQSVSSFDEGMGSAPKSVDSLLVQL